MDEELEFLKTIAQRLDEAGFDYMLSGSIALNFYAEPRMTRDIDVIVDLAPEAAERFAALFSKDCYVDVDTVRDAAARRDTFIIHEQWVIKADFVVRRDEPYRLEELSRRRRIDVEGIGLYVVAPEDLVLSKLAWARDSQSEMQRRDVANILRNVDDLDWSYLQRWADELGIRDMLEAARR